MRQSLCSRRSKKDIPVFLVGAALIFQLAALAAANLAALDSACSYDSGTTFSAALEMWRQKSLVLQDFGYATSLLIDSPAPLAALLFGITGRFFLAYGLANLLIMTGNLLCLRSILRAVGGGTPAFLLASVLLVTPYSPWQVGYAQCVVWGHSCYSVRVLFLLVVLRALLALRQGEFVRAAAAWCLAGAAAVCVTAFSSGLFFAEQVLAPLLVAVAALAVWHGELRRYAGQGGYLLLLCLLTLAGMGAARLLAPGTAAGAGTMAMNDAAGIAGNVSRILAGWLDFWGAGGSGEPLSESPVQIGGVFRFFWLAGAGAALAAAFRIPAKDREHREYRVAAITMACFNVAVMLLMQAPYSGNMIDGRYFLLPFVPLILVLALGFEKLLASPRSQLSVFVAGAVCLLVLVNTATVLLREMRTDLSDQKAVTAAVQQQGGTLLLDYGTEASYRSVGRMSYPLSNGTVYGVWVDPETGKADTWGAPLCTGEKAESLFAYIPADSPLQVQAQKKGTAVGDFARGTLYQISDTAAQEWLADVCGE